jgi:uncharacterized protein YhfF
MWKAFARHANLAGADYAVFAFGDTPEMASELVALVIDGTKAATASLKRDFTDAGEPVPCPGDFWVVLDGQGSPQCVLRTTEVQVKPLAAVDDRFAWEEGEGDRTRGWWLDAHRRYFARQALRHGFTIDDTTETVFERFEVVWPPEDPRQG